MIRRPRNPALWLLIGVPIVGVTLALITLGAAFATDDGPFDATVAVPLSKTSWQDHGSGGGR